MTRRKVPAGQGVLVPEPAPAPTRTLSPLAVARIQAAVTEMLYGYTAKVIADQKAAKPEEVRELIDAAWEIGVRRARACGPRGEGRCRVSEPLNLPGDVAKPKRPFNLPIGTIRVVRNNPKSAKHHRDIKVAMGGPPAKRWMGWARWWWLKNRGPIAPRMRVLHRDGDTMNDDPSNFVLGTAADQAYINHSIDPKMSERNYRLASKATTKMNRKRGETNRAENWLPRSWYPVDHDRKLILNLPCRVRWTVWGAAGFELPTPPELGTSSFNGEGVDAAALGWPGRSVLAAILLGALAAQNGEEVSSALLFERVTLMRRHRSMRPLVGRLAAYSVMVPLRHDGLIQSRRGVGGSFYWITPAGLASRGAHCAITPMRGCQIREEWSGRVAGLLAGYRRESPAVPPDCKAQSQSIRERMLLALPDLGRAVA